MTLEKKPLRILFIAAEADPLIKVGGLGDVAFSLPMALRSLDPEALNGYSLDIRLVIPYHASVRKKISDSSLVAAFNIHSAEGDIATEVYYTEYNGYPIYLLSGSPFLPDLPVYSSDAYQDGYKFTFFSLAVLQLMKKLKWRPDVIHANDWHTAIAVSTLKEIRPTEKFFKKTRSVMTIHNLPFMGTGTEKAMESFGVGSVDDQHLPIWARHIPLPMGLSSADQIVTVSPTYAQEIRTPDFGCGLQSFFKSRTDSISGIINGLDYKNWNPETDQEINYPYSIPTIDERYKNKAALLQEFSLDPDLEIPLLIFIGRVDQQKGLDLALEAMHKSLNHPWQAIILGTGDIKLQEEIQKFEAEYPNRIRSALRFDPTLSHKMYASGDILLMPSRYEPCGLAQMIAMHYGCVPCARSTGGLKDTIIPYPSAGSTGFLFDKPNPDALISSLKFAISTFKKPAEWREMQIRGMNTDFSWQNSALSYARLYINLKEKPV